MSRNAETRQRKLTVGDIAMAPVAWLVVNWSRVLFFVLSVSLLAPAHFDECFTPRRITGADYAISVAMTAVFWGLGFIGGHGYLSSRAGYNPKEEGLLNLVPLQAVAIEWTVGVTLLVLVLRSWIGHGC